MNWTHNIETDEGGGGRREGRTTRGEKEEDERNMHY